MKETLITSLSVSIRICILMENRICLFHNSKFYDAQWKFVWICHLNESCIWMRVKFYFIRFVLLWEIFKFLLKRSVLSAYMTCISILLLILWFIINYIQLPCLLLNNIGKNFNDWLTNDYYKNWTTHFKEFYAFQKL